MNGQGFPIKNGYFTGDSWQDARRRVEWFPDYKNGCFTHRNLQEGRLSAENLYLK
jgi:hypothetical protein